MEGIMGEEEPYPMIDELMEIEKKYLAVRKKRRIYRSTSKIFGLDIT